MDTSYDLCVVVRQLLCLGMLNVIDKIIGEEPIIESMTTLVCHFLLLYSNAVRFSIQSPEFKYTVFPFSFSTNAIFGS